MVSRLGFIRSNFKVVSSRQAMLDGNLEPFASSDFSLKQDFFAKRTKIRGLSSLMCGCWGRTMKDIKGVTNNKGHVVFFYCLFFSGRWNLLIFSTSGASFGGMQPNLVWVLLFVRFTGGSKICTFLPDTEIAPFGYGVAVS